MEIKHQDNDRAERKEFSMKVWMFDYLGTQAKILRLRVLPLRNAKLNRKTSVENKDKESPSQTAFILLPKHNLKSDFLRNFLHYSHVNRHRKL